MKRSEYANEKNESEGRSAKKRALRRFGEFKLAKRGKEGGKLGIWERCEVYRLYASNCKNDFEGTIELNSATIWRVQIRPAWKRRREN